MEECLDRINIQVYSLFDLNQYPSVFKHDLLTLYSIGQTDSSKVIQYCLKNDIHIVTMPAEWISNRDDLKLYAEYNIQVKVYTLNDMTQMKNLSEYGVWGFYTDYISQSILGT